MFDIYLGLRNSIVTHSCQRCSMGAGGWQHDMYVCVVVVTVAGGDQMLPPRLPWGINFITHTAGGGKENGRGERE